MAGFGFRSMSCHWPPTLGNDSCKQVALTGILYVYVTNGCGWKPGCKITEANGWMCLFIEVT